MLRILYYNYFVKRKKYFENKDNRGKIKEGRKWRAEYKSDFEVKFQKKK